MKYKEALQYAMDLCSRQERCRSEVTAKLSARKLDPADIEKILSALEKEKFLDESRYAATFTRDKLRLNKWGRVKIRFMLQQKHIPGSIIEESFGDIEEEQYIDILKEELVKKRKTIRGGSAYDVRNKLFRFAQQRGFETGAIQQALKEVE